MEHYKIWGSSYVEGGGRGYTGAKYNIDASAEIWRFFSQYDMNDQGPSRCTVVRSRNAVLGLCACGIEHIPQSRVGNNALRDV